MINKLDKIITTCFYVLLFFVPLALYPKTSEVFEFNKIILTYALTAIVFALWATKSIIKKKIIFTKTPLDIPLLIFLGSQVLATIFSIDPRTSLLGYYTRFNGGLLSLITYAILYWAYVSNLDRRKALKSLLVLLSSAVLVSTYGLLQHLGIDKNIWVQDVQNRIFSTLGQPNWLAAWITALSPITWVFALNRKPKIFFFRSRSIWIALSTLFFFTLLYTKSRSGILGFVFAYLIFWGIYFLTELKVKNFKRILKNKVFIALNSVFAISILLAGTPWTPSVSQMLNRESQTANHESPSNAPALETGGTESGEIRKIVWRGAFNIWKNNPIIGSGVETFAYSYYNHRPVEHNLVSEWDFLYNKAHNEYLNFAANTGTVGLLAYLFLIFSIIKLLSPENSKSVNVLNLALMSGLSSLFVSNFFGFSVVPTNLLIFLFPAIAYVSVKGKRQKVEENKLRFAHLNNYQKTSLFIVYSFTLLLFYSIGRYWYADTFYLKGRLASNAEKYSLAKSLLVRAIDLIPTQPLYWNELGHVSAGLALEADSVNDEESMSDLIDRALIETEKAISLSPKNVNLIRDKASIFLKFSVIDPQFLLNARETLYTATELAPTDAKLYYNLGLTEARTGDFELAIKTLEKTVEMKTNYRNARFALGLFYADQGRTAEARQQLEYILEFINPNDNIVKQQLAEL